MKQKKLNEILGVIIIILIFMAFLLNLLYFFIYNNDIFFYLMISFMALSLFCMVVSIPIKCSEQLVLKFKQKRNILKRDISYLKSLKDMSGRELSEVLSRDVRLKGITLDISYPYFVNEEFRKAAIQKIDDLEEELYNLKFPDVNIFYTVFASILKYNYKNNEGG